MRKILFAFVAGLFCILTACNNESTVGAGADNSMAQKNLDASHVITKAFGDGDPSLIDSVVAADFVDHTAEYGDVGRDSLKAMIVAVRKAFPDMKAEVIKEVADNDYVFTLMRFTGTSSGAMNMPVGPYDMKALQVTRYKDGKAVEHWEYMEVAQMMKMMGQMPPADSTKPTK